MRVLQDMHKCAARIMQALRLPGQAAAVLFIVGKNMDHGLALIGQLAINRVQVTQDMDEGAAALLAFVQMHFQRIFLLKQLFIFPPGCLQVHLFR